MSSVYTLLDDVADSHSPVQIAGNRHSAVLVVGSDWKAIQETLHLYSIPGMRDAIVKGLNTPVENCGKKLVPFVNKKIIFPFDCLPKYVIHY